MRTEDHPMFDARHIDPRVRLAMRVLEFEQTRPPGVDAVAARVGLSPYHFSRLFAAQVGESCAAYSRRIRLDASNNQMMHDPIPIEAVAATFGYAGQAAFTRAYTRQFGMPPRHYVETILGGTQHSYQASHLAAVEPADRAPPPLRGPVTLAEYAAEPALVRRFYGFDLASHWRRFLADLPEGIAEGARFAGLGYDNARVTPERHWRYDCAVVPDGADGGVPMVAAASGLDPVELPGGLHATTRVEGGFADLWPAAIGLFTQWLPAHPEYRPQGDPVVHWFDAAPCDGSFAATATIRIYRRDAAPAYNLPPLTRFGRPAGRRTIPAHVVNTFENSKNGQ